MKNPFEIAISPDETYLHVRAFQVPYTSEIAQLLAREVVHFAKDLDVLGCLIDIRGTHSVSSVIDKYNFAYEKAKEVRLLRRWRYAFLIDHGDDSPGFIDTVMQNAGYMFQIFEDEGEAIDWLKGTQLG